MAYPSGVKNNAVTLRKSGYSLNEIQRAMNVPKNTLSVWMRDISLSVKAKMKLSTKIRHGQLIASENKKRKIQTDLDQYLLAGQKLVNKFSINKNNSLLLCSLIYWCEGAKDIYSGVRFMNSDPNLIKTFLLLLRNSFVLNENKFRACLHLHKYHDIKIQIQFWSDATKIPTHQFIKPFSKANTGKRIRDGYNGCISIRYHDVNLARRLLMVARAFMDKNSGD